VVEQGGIELAVSGEPANQPVELRPRPGTGDVVVDVDAQFVVQVVFERLAMPLD